MSVLRSKWTRALCWVSEAGWGKASSPAKCLPSMQTAPGAVPGIAAGSIIKAPRSLTSCLSAAWLTVFLLSWYQSLNVGTGNRIIPILTSLALTTKPHFLSSLLSSSSSCLLQLYGQLLSRCILRVHAHFLSPFLWWSCYTHVLGKTHYCRLSVLGLKPGSGLCVGYSQCWREVQY